MPGGESMIDEITQHVMDQIPKPARVLAPFRWFGGKGNCSKWILSNLPTAPHTTYVEPYAGAAGIFWRKPHSQVEVLNDLHSEIVNIYRVLQDRSQFDELTHRLAWTPYSREEFRKALQTAETGSVVDRAWSFFVRQNQGFGGVAKTEGDYGRSIASSNRGMAETCSKWRGRIASLSSWHDRLSRVQIDNVDALKCIRYWDTPETLFYIDPPYVLDTRKNRSVYKHEGTDSHHRELVDLLLTVQGQVVLSGYKHPIYEPLTQSGWRVEELQTVSHAAGKVRSSGLQGKGAALAKVPRTEVLWIKESHRVTCGPIHSMPRRSYDRQLALWQE